jgi:hypothetical protein
MDHTNDQSFSELVDQYQDVFETPGELHRMAAYHLLQAAKQHEISDTVARNLQGAPIDQAHLVQTSRHQRMHFIEGLCH